MPKTPAFTEPTLVRSTDKMMGGATGAYIMFRTVAMLVVLLIVLETLPAEAKRMGVPGRRSSGGTRAVPVMSTNIDVVNRGILAN